MEDCVQGGASLSGSLTQVNDMPLDSLALSPAFCSSFSLFDWRSIATARQSLTFKMPQLTWRYRNSEPFSKFSEQVESDLIWFCCFLPSTASREKSAAVGGGRFLNPFTESANVSLTEICYKDYLAPLARKLLVNFKVICPSLCDVLIDVIKNATLDLRDPAMGGP